MFRHAQHTMQDLQGRQNLLHMYSLPCGVNQLRTHIGLPCGFPKSATAHSAFFHFQKLDLCSSEDDDGIKDYGQRHLLFS